MDIYHPRDEELLREMRRVRRTKKRKRLLWGLLFWTLVSAVCGWFVLNRWAAVAVMRGSAMGETVPDGSLVVVLREDGKACQRGDIILYETEDGYQLKRILALGGDKLVLNPYGATRVNGQELEENYTQGRHADAGVIARRLTVPEDEIFVQGDQLGLSADSRLSDFGTVKTEQVTGRAVAVIWPPHRIANLMREEEKAPAEEEAVPTEAAPTENPDAAAQQSGAEQGAGE